MDLFTESSKTARLVPSGVEKYTQAIKGPKLKSDDIRYRTFSVMDSS
jgi:hypothetical protein